jgi:phosphoribosylformimino-5-aminoimidazole carboxamide ribotide isomerase
MALEWVAQGADRLHLVDLDGARDGRIINRQAIQAIVQQVAVPCELGGGIRDETTIATWLDLGLRQLVVGTRAVRDPAWFRQIARRFPRRLVLGIDARDGNVATDGWLQTSTIAATQLAREFHGEPLAGIVYTDISKDGMLAGPNFTALSEMKAVADCPLIASGGITEVADVARLAELGMDGCIIGRALYEGRFPLTAALAAAARGPEGDAPRGT